MRAVLPRIDPTDPTPQVGDLPDPVPGPDEVLLDVHAAGINHADLAQLAGRYPPPPGESEVPGLECAGVVLAGHPADLEGRFQVGQRVMALVAGGAHATRAAVPVGQLMAVPDNLSQVEAASIPEAGLTAWVNLVTEGGLAAGETVLVTGATGGMGTFTVQLARELGARVLAAGRNRERLARLGELGVTELFDGGPGLAQRVREGTGGRGVDLVLDLVGGQEIDEHLQALSDRGRLVVVGVVAGTRLDLDLRLLMRKRLRLIGSVLRARSRAEKARLVADFAAFALPRLADRPGGRLLPVVDRVFPLEEAPAAYAALAGGGVFGKIVLTTV
jgi:putative PIG3 family NAD(P)H quinone oxidoreductase